mmetsp:Transcript_119113/g.372500  ORF Transcript_119113/g.372500 Transcript_119113/m.372500 type:complete len:462 (+) Transcript_119113:785-2170(+)
MRWPSRWSVSQSCSSSAAKVFCSLLSRARVSARSSAPSLRWRLASSSLVLPCHDSSSVVRRLCSAPSSSLSLPCHTSSVFFSSSWPSRIRNSNESRVAATVASSTCKRSKRLSASAHCCDASRRRPSSPAAPCSRANSTASRAMPAARISLETSARQAPKRCSSLCTCCTSSSSSCFAPSTSFVAAAWRPSTLLTSACWPSLRRASRSPRIEMAPASSTRRPSSLASSSMRAAQAPATSRCTDSSFSLSESVSASRAATVARTSSETSAATSMRHDESFISRRWTICAKSPTSCLVAAIVLHAPASSSLIWRCRADASLCSRWSSLSAARCLMASSDWIRRSSSSTASCCRRRAFALSPSCSTVRCSSLTVLMTRSTVTRASARALELELCCRSASPEKPSTTASSRACASAKLRTCSSSRCRAWSACWTAAMADAEAAAPSRRVALTSVASSPSRSVRQD